MNLQELYDGLPEKYQKKWTFEEFSATFDTGKEQGVVQYDGQHKISKTLRENEFGGLASAFNVKIDSWTPSIIRPGAFADTLKDPAQMSRVKVLFQHSVPIGVPVSMVETKQGLEVVGKVSDTQVGRDVMTLMRDDVITEMSIGFDPVKFSFEEQDDELVRIIHAIKLWEFSPVTFGANSGARIKRVSSQHALESLRTQAVYFDLFSAKKEEPKPEPTVGTQRVEIVVKGLEPIEKFNKISDPYDSLLEAVSGVESVDTPRTPEQLEKLQRAQEALAKVSQETSEPDPVDKSMTELSALESLTLG